VRWGWGWGVAGGGRGGEEREIATITSSPPPVASDPGRTSQASATSAISLWIYIATNAFIAASIAAERHALDGLLAAYFVKAAAVCFDQLAAFATRGGGLVPLQAISNLSLSLSFLHTHTHPSFSFQPTIVTPLHGDSVSHHLLSTSAPQQQ
jgi:hypothetical protein